MCFRSGSAPGMENTGESIAIPQTADTMIIVKRTDDMDAQDQVEARVVKSRFSMNGKQTLIGVNYGTMCDQQRMENLVEGLLNTTMFNDVGGVYRDVCNWYGVERDEDENIDSIDWNNVVHYQ